MQEIKLLPSIQSSGEILNNLNISKDISLGIGLSHDLLSAYIYLLFGITGLVSVALVFHWYKYSMSFTLATIVTVLYGVVTLGLFGYLLLVVGLR